MVRLVAVLSILRVRRYTALCLLMFVSSAIPVLARGFLPADLSGTRRFGVRSWGIENGMPVTSIDGIVQTSDGYLWSGTEEGLIRFDGVRFTTFSLQTNPEMKDADITALATSPSGELWWGTRDGHVGHLSRGQMTVWNAPHGRVQALLPTASGEVWVGSMEGLAILRSGTFASAGLPPLAIYALTQGRDGTIYIGAENGIFQRRRGGVLSRHANEAAATFIRSLHVARDGAVWAGTDQKGVIRFAGNAAETWNTSRGLAANAVYALSEDPDGGIWIGTNGGGIDRWFRGEISHVDGLQSELVWSLLVDREGNVWAGTRGGGISRIRQSLFLTLTTDDGLAGNIILALNQDSSKAIWVGTAGRGVTRIAGREVSNYGNGAGFNASVILTIANDRDGSVLLGTVNGGLVRYRDGAFTQVLLSSGAENDTVTAALVARDGTLWVASHQGLTTVRQGRPTLVASRATLGNGQIVTLLEDRRGRIWIGTDGGGLFRITGSSIRRYGKSTGLSSINVLALYESSDGVIWVGTGGGGLCRLENDRISIIRRTDGLAEDKIYQIVEDTAGDFWMGSNNGIFKVAKRDLNAFAAGLMNEVRSVHYGKDAGLRTLEINGGIFPPALRSDDGTLFFPTSDGLAVTDGRSDLRPVINPLVEQIRTSDVKRYGGNGPIALGAGTDRMEIDYSAPSFIAPESLTFRYRLGSDSYWVDAATRRTAYYTNLAPGHYIFELQVKGSDGLWRALAQPLSFSIAPYFYQRRLFYLFVALLIALALFMAHRMRTRALRRRTEQLTRLVEEKTEVQEALGESEARFRSLVENSLDLIMIIDGAGRIAYASPSADRVLTLTTGALTGKQFSELVHPFDLPHLAHEILGKLDSLPVASTDLRLRRSDGDYVPFTIVRHRIGSDHGPEKILINCRDLSFSTTLTRQLEQANRVGSLGRLAATVAHEFNNVMMGVLTFAESIHRRSSDSGSREMAARILQSVRRGKRITDEILGFTRGTDPVIKPFHAASWLERLSGELREIGGDSVTLEIDTGVQESNVQIEADESQLSQVLSNLVINAKHAMSNGGNVVISLRSLTSTERLPFASMPLDRDMVHVEVRDNGTGISPEVLPHIFEPLYTTKKGGGTGLGLAVVHQIITRHGGHIFVESVRGKGTTFHLLVPSGNVTEQTAPPVRPAVSAPPHESAAAAPVKVLLVEDDEGVAEGIILALSDRGFDVRSVSRGSDALPAITSWNPHVVVLDVGLPDMDGTAVFEQIRGVFHDLPVVFSTGHGDEALLGRFLEHPGVSFLLKPYDMDTLVSVIEQLTPPDATGGVYEKAPVDN